MAGDDERLAGGGQPQKDVAHLDARLRVQTVGRFVQNEHFRVVQQRPGQPNPLPHAVAEALDVAVAHVGAAGRFHNRLDAPLSRAGRDAEGGSEEVEVLPDPHVVVGTEDIRHVADQSLDAFAVARTIGAGDAGRASGRPELPDQDLDGCRFAGPVGTDEAEDAAAVQGQRQMVQRQEVAVFLGQPVDDHDRRVVRTHIYLSSGTRPVSSSCRSLIFHSLDAVVSPGSRAAAPMVSPR